MQTHLEYLIWCILQKQLKLSAVNYIRKTLHLRKVLDNPPN